jgi:hypothetical protein
VYSRYREGVRTKYSESGEPYCEIVQEFTQTLNEILVITKLRFCVFNNDFCSLPEIIKVIRHVNDLSEKTKVIRRVERYFSWFTRTNQKRISAQNQKIR